MAMETDSSTRSELVQRVAQLERQLNRYFGVKGNAKPMSSPEHQCSVPELPPREMGADVSVERARLIVYTGRKWVNETVLHYHFLNSPIWQGGENQKDIVREAFDVWKAVRIGIGFEEVTSPEAAEIRIGFQQGDGYWSYLGRDVLRIGQHERTMNFGSDLTLDPRGVDVPVHEIGHSLGFPHEHQNPKAGIVWDVEAVVDYFSGSPNFWDLNMINQNILKKIPRGQIDGSDWDPDSVMHYAFRAGLIRQPEEYRDGLTPASGLSEMDRAQVKVFYPEVTDRRHTELRPYDAQRLSLSPGDQKNFSIEPDATREYTIQTFGSTDSVMVLFEEDQNGNFQYVAGDDDGGWDRNARIRVRLYSGRKYALRIRLYYQWASGDTTVMLW